jgi:hypothetical protein
VFDGPRNLQLKAMFRAMLLARDPGWNHGTGSYGAFRWDIRSDWVTHRHCARSQGRERMIGHGLCIIPPRGRPDRGEGAA